MNFDLLQPIDGNAHYPIYFIDPNAIIEEVDSIPNELAVQAGRSQWPTPWIATLHAPNNEPLGAVVACAEPLEPQIQGNLASILLYEAYKAAPRLICIDHDSTVSKHIIQSLIEPLDLLLQGGPLTSAPTCDQVKVKALSAEPLVHGTLLAQMIHAGCQIYARSVEQSTGLTDPRHFALQFEI